MGFNDSQIYRMVKKIASMPRHHLFLIGPVGCEQHMKLLFRIEKKHGKIYLFDAAINKQRACCKDPLEAVFGILKMVDCWDDILRYHNDTIQSNKYNGNFVDSGLHAIKRLFNG